MRTPITVVRLDLHRRAERGAQGLLGFHHHAVGAEGLRQLLPIDAAELHAVQRECP